MKLITQFFVIFIIHFAIFRCFSCFTDVKLQFFKEFIQLNENKCVNIYIEDSQWSTKQRQGFLNAMNNITWVKFVKIGNFHVENSKNSINIIDLTKESSLLPAMFQAPNLLLVVENESQEVLCKDCSFLLAKFLRQEQTITLFKYYSLNNEVFHDYLTTWSKDNGLLRRHLQGKRPNFLGRPFKIAIVITNPQNARHLDDFREQEQDTYSKVNYAPILRLLEFYNLTGEFFPVKNYSHLENHQNSLLTVTAPYMTAPWLAHANFLKVSPAGKRCWLLREPPTSFMTTIFTVAFAPAVWYAILGMLALLSIGFWALLNTEARRQDIKGQKRFTSFDLLLIAFEAICQQGTSTDPASYSSRILAVVYFLSFMFLYVAYSANILVLLQSTTSLTSPADLTQFRLNSAILDTNNVSYAHYLHADPFKDKQLETRSQTMRLDTGMEDVRGGLFAFFVDSAQGLQYARMHFSDYQVCSLQELAPVADYNLGYAALSKNSSFFYELFKIGLLRMNELGFVQRQYLKYFLKPRCYSKGSSYDTIGLREVYQAIFLVAIGGGAGLLILGLEMALKSKLKFSTYYKSL